MSDIVVTVPLSFGLQAWIEEGDLPGDPWSGEEWHFYLGGPVPKITPGERVYVVYGGRLRGYAPLVRIDRLVPPLDRSARGYALVRHGGAEAVTIAERIVGFRGFRYRFWPREEEHPWPEWWQA